MAEIREIAEKYTKRLYLKLNMTYVENIFDYTEILCRNI